MDGKRKKENGRRNGKKNDLGKKKIRGRNGEKIRRRKK